ncbi:MAG: hypothetical protein HY331_14965 [Chloroflexi bacterium]|nr:hypothetical protein [Chloroflexota bacterium]
MAGDALDDTIETARDTWQQFFLRRMMRLVELRARSLPRLNESGTRLINRAIYSTYLDCHRLGVGKLARAILEQAAHAGPAPSTAGPASDTL